MKDQLFVIAALLIMIDISGGEMLQLRPINTAKYIGSGRWDWNISLRAEEHVLDQIKYVEYTLHPSFPDPLRTVTNRASNFGLVGNGWGEFVVPVKVVFKDGQDMYLKHKLTLAESRSETNVASASPRKITVGNSSKYIGEDRWNWSIFIKGDDKTLNEVQWVEYTLHPTFPDPIRRVGERGAISGRGFSLTSNGWGTFRINVKVMFKNGEVGHYKHQLSFEDERKSEIRVK